MQRFKIWMTILAYPIIAWLFSQMLFHSFPSEEMGKGLGMLFWGPVTIIVILIIMIIHYILIRKKCKTIYFQIITIAIIIALSIYSFLDVAYYTPIDVIKKMIVVRKNYDKININDYFAAIGWETYINPEDGMVYGHNDHLSYIGNANPTDDSDYYRYTKILAAKKKFYTQIADTSYAVVIFKSNNDNDSNDAENLYRNNKNMVETYGINFFTDTPVSTNPNLIIEKTGDGSFRFTEYLLGDTIVFTGTKELILSPSPLNIYIDQRIKSEVPYGNGWAYKVFYWLLPKSK